MADANYYNNKFSLNEVSFTYLPRTKCLNCRQAQTHAGVQGYPGSDPRLYTRCVQCGIVFPKRADNIQTLYY